MAGAQYGNSTTTKHKEKEKEECNSEHRNTHRNKRRQTKNPENPRSDIFSRISRDVLHPNRPNVSKDELREKLADLYKSNKDQVSVFGFRTQYGGGKSTGFALVYDSSEALKKFEPHYRLVRIGAASKIEKASRQQRMFFSPQRLSIAKHGCCVPSFFANPFPFLQASNGRTAPRSSAVSPRSRAPRRARIKRLICNYSHDSTWTDDAAWRDGKDYGGDGFGSGVSHLVMACPDPGAVGRVWGEWFIFLFSEHQTKTQNDARWMVKIVDGYSFFFLCLLELVIPEKKRLAIPMEI
jgi:ribosomal protein S24E